MTIRSGAGTYPIRFGAFDEAMESLPQNAALVTDRNVMTHWGGAFPSSLPCYVLPPGEDSKSLAVYGALQVWLAEIGADRETTVVAIGGGVVGDLAGFAAASYMRGVRFIQVPTTLLAQVDSSVGGKVGIDLPQGKNLVGAFYSPEAVWVSLDTLTTLEPRHFTNGMAEVWKYGFILDPALLETLRVERLTPNHSALERVVRRCIELKAQVVEADERETSGLRAILNFGHTMGHALETVTGYGPVLHGEAISVGMALEARLGSRLGITPVSVPEQVEDDLQGQGLPIWHEACAGADAMLEAMRRDKKAKGGRLAFSLLTELGGCKLIDDVPESDVRAILTRE